MTERMPPCAWALRAAWTTSWTRSSIPPIDAPGVRGHAGGRRGRSGDAADATPSSTADGRDFDADGDGSLSGVAAAHAPRRRARSMHVRPPRWRVPRAARSPCTNETGEVFEEFQVNYPPRQQRARSTPSGNSRAGRRSVLRRRTRVLADPLVARAFARDRDETRSRHRQDAGSARPSAVAVMCRDTRSRSRIRPRRGGRTAVVRSDQDEVPVAAFDRPDRIGRAVMRQLPILDAHVSRLERRWCSNVEARVTTVEAQTTFDDPVTGLLRRDALCEPKTSLASAMLMCYELARRSPLPAFARPSRAHDAANDLLAFLCGPAASPRARRKRRDRPGSKTKDFSVLAKDGSRGERRAVQVRTHPPRRARWSCRRQIGASSAHGESRAARENDAREAGRFQTDGVDRVHQDRPRHSRWKSRQYVSRAPLRRASPSERDERMTSAAVHSAAAPATCDARARGSSIRRVGAEPHHGRADERRDVLFGLVPSRGTSSPRCRPEPRPEVLRRKRRIPGRAVILNTGPESSPWHPPRVPRVRRPSPRRLQPPVRARSLASSPSSPSPNRATRSSSE